MKLSETTSHVVLYGDDDYQIEQVLHQLRTELIDPNFGALNHKVLYQPDIRDCVEACASVALGFGAKSVVEIHQPSFFEKAVKETSDEKALDQLKETIGQVDANQKICIWVAPKLDSRIKFGKWIVGQKGFIQAVKFEKLKFWQTDVAKDVLKQMAKSKNIAIDDQALEGLVDAWGVDLRQLSNELEKLSTYALDKPISQAMVKALSAHHDNVFLMVDNWLLQTNSHQGLPTLREVLLTQHPTPLIAGIQGYIANIFKTFYYLQKGYNPDQVAQKTHQKPFTVKNQIKKFRAIKYDRLLMAKQKLLEIDWKIKTGQANAIHALECLLAS